MAALAGVHVGVDENAFVNRNPSCPSLSRLGVFGFPPSKHRRIGIVHVSRQSSEEGEMPRKREECGVVINCCV